MFKTFLTTFLAAYLALCGHALAGCAQSATITAETDVYSETPVFVTGNGWTFGTHVTTLQPGTPIDICGEKEVGVLIDKKLWYWIEYRLDHEEGNGWIFSGRTSLGFLDTPEPRKLAKPFGLGLISAAHA